MLTRQPSPPAVVHRDMKPENVTLEAARRERLTREELHRENGADLRPSCLCGPGEVCFCDITKTWPSWSRQEEHMADHTKISKRQALKAANDAYGHELDGMARMLGGPPRAKGEHDDAIRDQIRMLLDTPPAKDVA